jgi:hypothetical protein
MVKPIEEVRAEHAVKAADARLVAQAAGLAALEARATSLIGWTAAAIAALIAVLFAQGVAAPLRVAALSGGVALALAAREAVRCLRPGDWTMPGHLPQVVLQAREGETAAEFQQSLAEGYEAGIRRNSVRLGAVAEALAWALRALLLAPAAAVLGGGLGYLLGLLQGH